MFPELCLIHKGKSPNIWIDPKFLSSYKIGRIEELVKFYNNVLAAVDRKCNIRFVLSVVQEYVLSDSNVFFST